MNAVHKPASIEQRLEPLVRGWSAAPNGPAQIVASMLARQLGTEPQDFALAQDTLAFKLDLSRIRFRGMHEAHCILAGGERPETAVWVRLAAGARGLGRIVVVCAVNPTLADRLRLLTADQRCVVLGIEQIRALLLAENATSRLRSEILRSMPLGSLIPYDILQPASGAMFFGRSSELRRLRDEYATNFAIVGPGKAGKTSLVKHYLRLAREEKGVVLGQDLIDLMECPKAERTDLGYARFIAGKIGIKSPKNVGNFLADLRELDKKQVPTLALDEADDLCLDDGASDMIANIARNTGVRILLCGKGDLYRSLRSQRSHFANRLEPLQLGPLDIPAAQRLLVEPLEDLNIVFEDPKSADEIVHFTGALPHLIQLYAKRIAEWAIEKGKRTMDSAILQHIRENDSEIAQYVLSPLGDFRDPRAKLIALTLLKDFRNAWNASEVSGMVEELSVHDAADLCNELVISNVLMWTRGSASFKLANVALREHSQREGYLNGLLEDALNQYRKTKKGRVQP